MLMTGYRLQPDLTAAALTDGWLTTADLGYLDADGRLTISGRVDDVIISGGENVAAHQVADLLRRHPAVGEVEVVGVADPQWGQKVVAVVVSSGGSPPSLAELREWCRDLPAAARPRDLVVVDALPTLASGKPDRLAVRRLAGDPSSGDAGE
jgi:O-succinylbenzoic acid--CoA ligase